MRVRALEVVNLPVIGKQSVVARYLFSITFLGIVALVFTISRMNAQSASAKLEASEVQIEMLRKERQRLLVEYNTLTRTQTLKGVANDLSLGNKVQIIEY